MNSCLFLLIVVTLLPSKALGQFVDFEDFLVGGVPTSFGDLDLVTTQYQYLGLTFSVRPPIVHENEPLLDPNRECDGPRIAKVGGAVTAFTLDGVASAPPICNVADTQNDMPEPNSQSVVGCSFLTDDDKGGTFPCALVIDYDRATTSASGFLLDIDQEEAWRITAFPPNATVDNPVVTVDIYAAANPGFPNNPPGTRVGDGVATRWEIASEVAFDRLIIDYLGPPGLTVGLGFDGFSPLGVNVFDHFECYKMKTKAKLKGVVDLLALQSGFGGSGCKITKAKEFCVPVMKTVVQVDTKGTTTPNPNFQGPGQVTDLICYGLKCPETPPDLEVEDQFGIRSLTGLKARRLCVPADKVLDAP